MVECDLLCIPFGTCLNEIDGRWHALNHVLLKFELIMGLCHSNICGYNMPHLHVLRMVTYQSSGIYRAVLSENFNLFTNNDNNYVS